MTDESLNKGSEKIVASFQDQADKIGKDGIAPDYEPFPVLAENETSLEDTEPVEPLTGKDRMYVILMVNEILELGGDLAKLDKIYTDHREKMRTKFRQFMKYIDLREVTKEDKKNILRVSSLVNLSQVPSEEAALLPALRRKVTLLRRLVLSVSVIGAISIAQNIFLLFFQ